MRLFLKKLSIQYVILTGNEKTQSSQSSSFINGVSHAAMIISIMVVLSICCLAAGVVILVRYNSNKKELEKRLSSQNQVFTCNNRIFK